MLAQDPDGGGKAPKKSTVTLTVAQKKTTTVPPVVGKSFDEAKAQLEGLGFEVARRTWTTSPSPPTRS